MSTAEKVGRTDGNTCITNGRIVRYPSGGVRTEAYVSKHSSQSTVPMTRGMPLRYAGKSSRNGQDSFIDDKGNVSAESNALLNTIANVYSATVMSSKRRPAAGGGPSRQLAISKALSWVLRHGAEKEGLALDDAGYANVAELVIADFTLALSHDALKSTSSYDHLTIQCGFG